MHKGHRVFAASRSLGTMETLSIGIERIELDVNSEESIGLGIEKIVARAGRIDILVNNAGQGCIGALVEVSMQKMRDTFDVNVFGLMGMIQKVSPVMIAQRNGLIINIGSMVSIVPTPWAGVCKSVARCCLCVAAVTDPKENILSIFQQIARVKQLLVLSVTRCGWKYRDSISK